MASLSCHGDSLGTSIAVHVGKVKNLLHTFGLSDLCPTTTSTEFRNAQFIVKPLIWICPYFCYFLIVCENTAKLTSRMKVLWLITANWLFHCLLSWTKFAQVIFWLDLRSRKILVCFKKENEKKSDEPINNFKKHLTFKGTIIISYKYRITNLTCACIC